MRLPHKQISSDIRSTTIRIRFWYAVLLLVMGVFIIRLFFLQIIKHDYYKKVALQGQLKEYEIKAERGIISAHEGKNTIPIVLNETKFTLFADPKFITNHDSVGIALQQIIGGNANDYVTKMKLKTRYSVLAKKLSKEQKDKISKLDYKGIGLREESYRTYPQGQLAAQLLGFVNEDGEGKYGIEQALGNDLKGVPGELKAITDAQGVPLVTNTDNIITEPKIGKRVLLTLDISMQKQVEDILKAGLDAAKSKSGSVIVMDPNNGAIKAMANFPSYNPAEYFKVEDGNVFNNDSVSSPLEVGSVMKVLTAAAALDKGLVTRNSSYYDPSFYMIDGFKITNVEEDGGAGQHNIADILRLSLNTGATWLLMQMGGGEVNLKARMTWNDYMVNHYNFSKATGIEQGFEAEGTIPDPKNGYGLNLQYANTAFGQGMTATPLQLGAALSSVINGGSYYRPHLVDQTTDSDGKVTIKKPEVLNQRVIKPDASNDIRSLMEETVQKNHTFYGLPNLRSEYAVGGKTGTAQISKPGGGYYSDRFNGTFIGYVGGDRPQYVIVVRVNDPKTSGYAGARTAAPIFSNVTNMLIDNFGVTPKGQ